jgi:DNA-binding response OmpR family regulator
VFEMNRLLIVEDDPMIAMTLKMSLPYNGFEVEACDNIRDAHKLLTIKSFDIILLDVMLPDGSGLDFCEQLRSIGTRTPILVLTAKLDEESAVRGIEAGADDYVRKPFGMKELVARINRIMNKSPQTIIEYKSLKINLATRSVHIGLNTIFLGKKEFDLLALLMKKKGEIASRSDLLSAIDEDADIFDRTIDSHISHLRRKLKAAGLTDLVIGSVYGVGYQLTHEERAVAS